MERTLQEKKAFAFEVANIVNELDVSDARSIYLVAQALRIKKEEALQKENLSKKVENSRG